MDFGVILSELLEFEKDGQRNPTTSHHAPVNAQRLVAGGTPDLLLGRKMGISLASRDGEFSFISNRQLHCSRKATRLQSKGISSRPQACAESEWLKFFY